jgi:Pyridine nucleotide-disulphide oxidoreductase
MGLGALIWLSIILMPTLNALVGSFHDDNRVFFILETICVMAFAVSFMHAIAHPRETVCVKLWRRGGHRPYHLGGGPGCCQDVVVIGIGPGGEDAAGKLAQAGLHVTGVEASWSAVNAPYWGCVPARHLAAQVPVSSRRSQPSRNAVGTAALTRGQACPLPAFPQLRAKCEDPSAGQRL